MDEELETFETYVSPESISPTTEYEGTNAARFALMAFLGGDDQDVAPVRLTTTLPESLAAFGLNPELAFRVQPSSPEESASREAEFFLSTFGDGWESTDIRYRAFHALNVDAQVDARLALLAAGLSSSLERESVTAASAILTSVPRQDPPPSATGWNGWPFRFLDRRIDSLRFAGPVTDFVAPLDEDGESAATLAWDGDGWERYSSYWLRAVLRDADPSSLLAALRFLAQVRVDLAQRSADPIVRELSFASYLNQPDLGVAAPEREAQRRSIKVTEQVSTMVHGTRGWKGSWWYPRGDFHSYIAGGVRPALYAGGQEFSWSGAYSDRQRATGGERFQRWVQAAGGETGLGTVFAHSYGGEIVARAVNAGAIVDEVVFLSAPIHSHHRQMLSGVRRVIDIRLDFDIVLFAARAAQRLPAAPNVTEHVVNKRFWSHGATHHPTVWINEGIASAVGL